MTITMWCDHCGEEIPASTNGGVRVRTAHRELRLHLCSNDQAELHGIIFAYANGKAIDVSPSLKKP